MSNATITISIQDFTELTEKKVISELKVKELQAKIDELTILVAKHNKPKKEPTTEEVEAIKQKRSEAGKKAAAKRAEKLFLKKEEERLKLYNELKDQIKSESEPASDTETVESSAESA